MHSTNQMQLLAMSPTDSNTKIDLVAWHKKILAVQEELNFQVELLDFKEDESIHPEIREAFIKILYEEGMLYGTDSEV